MIWRFMGLLLATSSYLYSGYRVMGDIVSTMDLYDDKFRCVMDLRLV
jgi:hypothetical protein